MAGSQDEDLAAKLDRDLDDFIEQQVKDAEKRREKEGPEKEQSIDELIEELQGHPAFAKEVDMSKPLHPAMEALQSLKYEGDDPTETASNYKDEGNYNFKHKQYRTAIISYTEGIKCRCPDRLLNAQLYCNRAASHSFLGNFRSAFLDCIMARKFKPDHLKAILKGIQCSLERKRYEDAIKWCDDALLLNHTDKKVLNQRAKAEKLLKQQQRDRRREIAKERKEEAEEKNLLEEISKRGVKIAKMKVKRLDPILLSSLECHHPSGAKVFLSEDGFLQWPVMFLYPEHSQTDFIEQCHENSCLVDQINFMFGPGEQSPPWDLDKKYQSSSLDVYFEDKKDEKLYRVDSSLPLVAVLKHERLVVEGGTPAFIILVRDSPFAKSYLARYAFS